MFEIKYLNGQIEDIILKILYTTAEIILTVNPPPHDFEHTFQSVHKVKPGSAAKHELLSNAFPGH